MRKTALKATKEGYVRQLGRTADGKQPKFRLGTDEVEAARRRRAIEKLWAECEAKVRGMKILPVWDDDIARRLKISTPTVYRWLKKAK